MFSGLCGSVLSVVNIRIRIETAIAVGVMALRRLGVVVHVHEDGSVTCPRNNQVEVGWS